MMRHVFEQSGIKGAITAVAKVPDNAVSFFKMYDDYAWLYFIIFFSFLATDCRDYNRFKLMLLVLSKGSLIFSTWKFSQAFCLFFLGYCVARLKGNVLDVLFHCKSILIWKREHPMSIFFIISDSCKYWHPTLGKKNNWLSWRMSAQSWSPLLSPWSNNRRSVARWMSR